jgi:hypothetical protein
MVSLRDWEGSLRLGKWGIVNDSTIYYEYLTSARILFINSLKPSSRGLFRYFLPDFYGQARPCRKQEGGQKIKIPRATA